MTVEKRLDDKFREVLISRGEFEMDPKIQEAAATAAEKVMDIFKYPIDDGTKMENVLLHVKDGVVTFSVQTSDGKICKNHPAFCEALKHAIHIASGPLCKETTLLMIKFLMRYFTFPENSLTYK